MRSQIEPLGDTCPRRRHTRPGYIAAAGLFALALFGAGEASAGCVMQRQCRPAYRTEQFVQYQQRCNTMYFAGRRQTSCQSVPVQSLRPVAYQDCSQVKRVCSDLGSLVGSGRRR